jgi:hypothetical protein
LPFFINPGHNSRTYIQRIRGRTPAEEVTEATVRAFISSRPELQGRTNEIFAKINAFTDKPDYKKVLDSLKKEVSGDTGEAHDSEAGYSIEDITLNPKSGGGDSREQAG